MPTEAMKLSDEPAIILEAAKSAINLATKIHEFSNSLATLAAAITILVTDAQVKRQGAGDWGAQ